MFQASVKSKSKGSFEDNSNFSGMSKGFKTSAKMFNIHPERPSASMFWMFSQAKRNFLQCQVACFPPVVLYNLNKARVQAIRLSQPCFMLLEFNLYFRDVTPMSWRIYSKAELITFIKHPQFYSSAFIISTCFILLRVNAARPLQGLINTLYTRGQNMEFTPVLLCLTSEHLNSRNLNI